MSAAEIIQETSIRASQIAQILGISPHGDAWTQYATYYKLIEPQQQTEEMFWGTELQRVIARVFAERRGVEIEWWDKRIHHPERPWQAATPDAFILTEPRQVLEIKTVGFHAFGEWDREVANEDGVPDYYVAQVEWQLSTLGLETGWIAALFGGQHLHSWEIHHDPVLEEILLEEGEKFWRENLMGGVEPPIGGSRRAHDYLRRRYPRHRENLRPATLAETEWLNEYARLRRELDTAETRKKELENQLCQAIADAEGLSWPSGKMTWKKSKDSFEVNWEKLAKNQLAGFSDDEQAAFIGQYTHTVEGVRRIYFRQKALE